MFERLALESADIISINIWQVLISLANLLIIFLILKKFLWKPVKKVMDQRQAMVDKQFADAQEAQDKADDAKAHYEAKLATADEEAAARLAAADETARRHGDRVIVEARVKADAIIRQAEAEIDLERKKAQADIKQEIAVVGAALAEKLMEREMNAADHEKMIESFLDEVGDAT